MTGVSATHAAATRYVVFPKHARTQAEAQEQIDSARDIVENLGGHTQKELKKAAGLVAQLAPEQRQRLEAAGFNVLEDKPVRGHSGGLAPGALLHEDALRLVSDFLGVPWRTQEPGVSPRPEGSADFVGQLPTTGRGVGIAVLDSGIYPHPDLGDRLVKLVSATGDSHPDPVGHGTHVAVTAAGDGALSGGRLRGVAPEAHVIGVQVLNEEEEHLSDAIEGVVGGLDWVVRNKERYGIKVANLSLGMGLLEGRASWFGPSVLYDPLGASIRAAVDAGITVVAAAGNSGPEAGTIEDTPAIDENVITVGALDTKGTRDRRDDEVADFSSRGPTPDGRVKPDILAPGARIMSGNAPGSSIEQSNLMAHEIQAAVSAASDRELYGLTRTLVRARMLPAQALRLDPDRLRELLQVAFEAHEVYGRMRGGVSGYIALDGTSMASPIVAGVVANMYEANPNLTPQEVALILKKTADPLPGAHPYEQGHGVLDAQEAVAVAARLRSA